MKKTILLLVNAFDANKALLDYGIRLAKNMDAMLELFDVQITARSLPSRPLFEGPGVEEIAEGSVVFNQAEQNMRELYRYVKSEWEHVDFKLVKNLMYGKLPARENYWLEKINAINPVMVVAWVHHNLNLFNELFGTAETKIAETVNCPVLFVPDNIRGFSGLDQLAYMLDREKPLDEAAEEIRFLSNIVDPGKGIIKAYYLTDREGKAVDLEMGVIRGQLLKKEFLSQKNILDLSVHKTQKEIEDLVSTTANHLVAFPQRHKTFLKRLTDGDNTKRLVLKAKIPVLVF